MRVQFYIVGTGYVKPHESEPKVGRILVLELSPGKSAGSGSWDLKVVMEQSVNGGVYALVPITECPGKVAVTVNSQLCVFELDPSDKAQMLKFECKTKAQVVGLYAAVHGRTIIVGDLIKSVGMYHYSPEQKTLTLMAKELDGTAPDTQ
jgi:hypothetical protein